MKFSIVTAISFSCILSAVTACTWVELKPEGRSVTLKYNKDLHQDCERLGTVNAKTRASVVLGSQREGKKIAAELTTLARNEATRLDANTVVANTPVENGEQSYIAYRCP
ncbi:MAG: hypothetical protein ACI8VC_000094 [Candidatus Endobugula sp.]|jgi:hypothetical protein